MSLAVLVVTAAQLLDLGTFLRMIDVHGPASEANPLVAGMLLGQGLPLVVVAKIAGLAIVVAVIAVLANRDAGRLQRAMAGGVAVAAIVAGLLGGWTNTSTLI